MSTYLHIFEYALVSLTRRWTKHLSLVFIYAVLVGFYASVILLTSGLRQEAKMVLQDIPELWIQQIGGGRLQPIKTVLIDSLKNIRGVEKIYPRVWGYLPESSTGAVLTVMGTASTNISNIGADIPFIQVLNEKIATKDGKNNTISKNLENDEVIVGTGMLALRNLQLGDYLSISDIADSIRNFRIVASFDAKADLITKDLLIFSTQTAKELLSLKNDEATDIALKITNSDETDNIGKKIDNRFPSLRVVSKQQLQATYQTLFGWRGGLLLYGSVMALLAFVMLVWDKATGLSANEQKELGILKSVGWSINNVLWLKISEALIISLSATLLGLVLAYLHIFLFDASFLKPFLAGWSVLYPSFELPLLVDFGDLLLIAILSIVPYLTASIIPAWFAAVTDPAEIMR
jgi:ABC-type lipoprotein release transport system permease subunit